MQGNRGPPPVALREVMQSATQQPGAYRYGQPSACPEIQHCPKLGTDQLLNACHMTSPFVRAAGFIPASVNASARTVRATISTGAEVWRRDVFGPYIEALDLNGVDVAGVAGSPVLDAHRQGSVGDVIGVVQNAGRDGLGIWADIRFSERADALWQDVVAGILRGVSIGYSVDDWKDSQDAKGNRRRVAARWSIVEVSFVPVPADPGATVRGKETIMTDTTTATPAVTPAPEVQARAAVNAQIRSIGRTLSLGQDWIDSHIDAGTTVDQFRIAALDEAARRSDEAPIRSVRSGITVGRDFTDPQVRASIMGEALYTRINPAHKPSEAARPFMHLRISDMARECLRYRGQQVAGLSDATLITRAFGMHTTSDFPMLLGDTVGRVLRSAYDAVPSALKALGRETSASDFRQRYSLMLGEFPTLKKVAEGGEIQSGTMAEARESYKIDTYATMITLSRQLLVNDDLGAFADLGGRAGVAARSFEAQFLVDLLQQNTGNGPNMSDGKALFHADHGNKAGAGATLSDATLSAARLALRKQEGLSGQIIAVTPRYVLVPAELETKAETVLAAITPAKTEDVNPFSTLVPVVEPLLSSATRWYMAADRIFDGLEYAYLDGVAGPQIETKPDFDTFSVSMRVWLDFGAGFNDWRGWYMNPGA